MPISVKLKTNATQVIADLDAWVDAIVEVAAPQAVNKLRDQAQVAGLRAISRIYGISPRRFEKFVLTTIASKGRAEASLIVKGKGLPLYLFNPRVVRGRGGGVRVTIKGRNVFIPTAFIAKIRNASERDPEARDKVGVFARGAYGGKGKQEFTGRTFGKFHFGRKRLSINELFTFSRPEAFHNPEVIAAMNDRVKEQSESVFNAAIRQATRGQ
jgi:hypothetical protein